MTAEPRISLHGRCDLDEQHDAHILFPFGPDSGAQACPGQTVNCRNCDDRKCMDCVLRYIHDFCEDSCPMCCATVQGPLADRASR